MGTEVSIHATARVATSADRIFKIQCNTFQSTPPHGWRHPLSADKRSHQPVSIHATARVATHHAAAGPAGPIPVSIHATARVATQDAAAGHRPACVSIHATARVATRTRCRPSPARRCFNPRHRTGGDPETPLMCWIPRGKFQSTPPHGWRQPHPYRATTQVHVSIHATARVATTRPGRSMPHICVSIHATARVATLIELVFRMS